MSEPSPLSTSGVIAVAALAACGYIGGWLILLVGGFHHAPNRYTAQTTFVSGASALAMAAIFFALAAVGVAKLLNARRTPLQWQLIACGAVILPPLFFALWS
jgi:hypothetical protein